MEYKIEISMTFDEEMACTPYFWCILGRKAQGWCNYGHGWATSPEEAWRQAYKYYADFFLI